MPDPRETEFRELRAAFRREVQALVMVLNTYRYLHERRADFLDELNVAPAFFQTVFVALRTTWVVRSYSLLAERSKKALTIGTFLTFVRENLDLFSTKAFLRRRVLPFGGGQAEEHDTPTKESIDLDIQRVNQLPVVEGLRIQRHKFYAHLDPEYFANPDLLMKSAPIEWGGLKQIQDVLIDVLDRYSVAFDAEPFAFEPANMLDVQKVLDALRRDRTHE